MVSLTSFAQENTAEKEEDKTDTLQVSFRPKGIRIGIDMLGLAKKTFGTDRSELEFSADVEIHRYLVNFEYGQFESTQSGSDSSIYQNKGNYFRTGIDINLFKKDTDVNVLFFGLRYGQASFDDQLQHVQTNDLFGDGNFDRSNNSINARWYEVTSGIKLQIAHNFWLGFTNRLKFSLKMDKSESLTPFEVPGYGRGADTNTWGFNYLLMYQIPFKKKKK